MKQAGSGVFSATVSVPFGVPFGVVGQACGANPFALIMPCHRVTVASGLGGFLHHAGFSRHAIGFRVGVKRSLLAREGPAIKWWIETRQAARQW